ncbi:MAG: hypothetical protein ACD_75C02630G0006 [uncultured bacterium]|nr:MAG: hypothetical protein ACD_75C02630G0006 [uncultured bacterium]
MPSGHFISDRKFPFRRNIDLDHLHDAGRQIIPLSHSVDDAVVAFRYQASLFGIAFVNCIDQVDVLGFFGKIDFSDLVKTNQLYLIGDEFFAQLDNDFAFLIDDIALGGPSFKELAYLTTYAAFQAT